MFEGWSGFEVDAPEDGGQGDDDDRLVDPGHEHAQGGVGEDDPGFRSVAPGLSCGTARLGHGTHVNSLR